MEMASFNTRVSEVSGAMRACMMLCSTKADHSAEFRVFVEAAERHLRFLFRSIDSNHDGRVNREELEDACRKAGLTVSKSRFDGFFDELDMNHDGFISFGEFR
jgi:Ca2+-binding EF-hand superfamily protein